MRTLLLTLSACLAILPVRAQAQLVECNPDDDWAGKIICQDTELSVRARSLEKALDDVSTALAPQERAVLEMEQAEWRNTLSSCRTISVEEGISPKDCLIESLDQRIVTIRDMDTLSVDEGVSASVPAVNVPAGQDLLAAKPTGQEKYPAAVTAAEEDAAPAEVPAEPRAGSVTDPVDPTDAMVQDSQVPDVSSPALLQPAGSSRIDPGAASATIRECLASGTTQVEPCVEAKLENAEVELQIVASRLEMKLREMDIVRVHGTAENRFHETQRNFGDYREAQCHWLGSLAGDDAAGQIVYKGCFVDLTHARTAELQALYSVVR